MPHAVRRSIAALATAGTAAACCAAAGAASAPTLTLSHVCYLLGQRVAVSGSGFLPDAEYDLSVDGIDFGQALTDASGGFRVRFAPGGLGAGQAQAVDGLDVSDGVSERTARFTITRRTGALIGAGSGVSAQRKVMFEVWDVGPRKPVYVHYVLGGHAHRTVPLGTAGGQCGFLRVSDRPLFPFRPAAGRWTFQFDSSRRYSADPGRAVRIGVTVG